MRAGVAAVDDLPPLLPQITPVIAGGRLACRAEMLRVCALRGCAERPNLFGLRESMSAFPRYAIYFTPERESALYQFGADLLGYDAFSGNDRAFPESVMRYAPDWAELTAEPRVYGFHATLKAPFALAPDTSEAELMTACETFARAPRPTPVITPVVRSIASFIAIVPQQPSSELAQLADACVVDFDRFRAPLSGSERARRKPDALTPRQINYLDRWGYPYVMEEFRLHMTLTGRVAPERRDDLRAMLQARLTALNFGELQIDGLALFRQDHRTARFRAVKRYPAHSAMVAEPTRDTIPYSPSQPVQ